MQETTLKSSSPTMLVWSWWRQVQILVWRRGTPLSLLLYRKVPSTSPLGSKWGWLLPIAPYLLKGVDISHSSPQPWELTSPDTSTGQEVSNDDVQENGVDGFGDCDLDIPISSCSQCRPCRVINLWDLFSFRPICNCIQYQWLSGMGKSM